VQVDPIKPKFKPPGTKRLKLKCAILLSTSAFKCNLRRYKLDSAKFAETIKEYEARLKALAPGDFVCQENQGTGVGRAVQVDPRLTPG
jgi:hypothetical protein